MPASRHPGRGVIARGAPGWQLVLADLALILFLVTLCALATSAASEDQVAVAHISVDGDPELAPSQALFRPSASGPSIARWLAEQPRDPRAAVTIVARHSDGNRAQVWKRASDLAQDAHRSGIAVRVVITRGQDTDLYASLAYDAPEAHP